MTFPDFRCYCRGSDCRILLEVPSLSRSRWLSPSALSPASGCPSQSEGIYRRPMSVALGQQLPKKGATSTCPVCAKPFYRYRSQIKNNIKVTCSRTCAARHFRDKGETVPCKHCGKSIYRLRSRAKKGYGRFCSHNCELLFRHNRDTHARVRDNMFKDWQRKEWKDSKCAKCETTEDLQLDHITPRFLGGLPSRDNAQTLCGNCNRRKFWKEEYHLYRQLRIKQREATSSS